MIVNFIKQIEANPEDLFLREVFGDWLEENGYERECAYGYPLISKFLVRRFPFTQGNITLQNVWGNGLGTSMGNGSGVGSGIGEGFGVGSVIGEGFGNRVLA